MSRITDEQLVDEYRMNPYFHKFTKKVSGCFLYRYAQNIMKNKDEPCLIDVEEVVRHIKEDDTLSKFIDRFFEMSLQLLIHDGRLSTNTTFKNTLRYVDDRTYNIKKSIRTLKALE